MAKAQYRSALRSRRLINEALADLLQEKTLDKITVTELVNRADINRGTFYAHYADIPDVLNHLVEQSFCRLRDALTNSCCSLTELPGVIISQVEQMLREDLAFFQKMMDSAAAPILQEQLCSVMVDYLFAQESKYANCSHEDYVLTVRFCAGGLGNLYRDWFTGLLPISLEALSAKAVSLLESILAAM